MFMLVQNKQNYFLGEEMARENSPSKAGEEMSRQCHLHYKNTYKSGTKRLFSLFAYGTFMVIDLSYNAILVRKNISTASYSYNNGKY